MKKFFVLVNDNGLPYVSVRREPRGHSLVGICSDLASAKALMKAYLEGRDKGDKAQLS